MSAERERRTDARCWGRSPRHCGFVHPGETGVALNDRENAPGDSGPPRVPPLLRPQAVTTEPCLSAAFGARRGLSPVLQEAAPTPSPPAPASVTGHSVTADAITLKRGPPGVGPALKPATAEETLGEGRDTLGERHATTEGDGGQRGHTPGASRTAGSQRRPGASRGRLALRTARSFRYLALSRLCLSVTTASPAWRRPPVLHPSPLPMHVTSQPSHAALLSPGPLHAPASVCLPVPSCS